MSTTQKKSASMKYLLTGSTKKSGVNLWRFVFTASERLTGNESMFFIELAMLNPYLNPTDVLLGFKPRVKISSDDLQNVLAGTVSAQKLQSETLVIPSYVAVRAGIIGKEARQICQYFPVKDLIISNRSFDIQAGECHFDDSLLKGSVACSPKDLSEHPELLCDSGIINWSLRFENVISYEKGFRSKEMTWAVPGAKTVFSGSVTIDGREYDVIPKKSFGYVDRNWGKTYPSEWFHLSTSNFASLISGKAYQSSSISIQGVYENRLSLLVNFEGKELFLNAESGKRAYQSIWNCTQMPENEDGEKLHWSASFNNSKYMIDIDIFCPAKQLFVRSWELPEGERKTLKILTGGTGTGEIKMFKRHKKNNLELLEHCRLAGVLCEYGQIEVSDN